MSQQESFLRIDVELRLFNEQVSYVRALTDRSFTTTGANHQINEANLVEARRNLGTREAELIKAINRLLEADGRLRQR